MGNTAPSILPSSPSLLYCSPSNKATTRMASIYSRQNGLSHDTIRAWQQIGAHPRGTRDRRMFYLIYLADVVPFEVSVVHIPSHLQRHDITGASYNDREEIQLQYAGRVFMTAVVSMDHRPIWVERAAATLAYHHWREGRCVRDPHQAWGMFTATDQIRFFISRDGRNCDRTAICDPILDVRHVVAYIRQEFERIRHQ